MSEQSKGKFWRAVDAVALMGLGFFAVQLLKAL